MEKLIQEKKSKTLMFYDPEGFYIGSIPRLQMRSFV